MMDYREIFRCSCGGYHYLDVSLFGEPDAPDSDIEYSFGIVEMPPTFWKRVRALFTGRDVWVEVILSKAQVKQLSKALQEAVGE